MGIGFQNRMKGGAVLTQTNYFYFWVFTSANFGENRSRNATDAQTQTGLIICPMRQIITRKTGVKHFIFTMNGRDSTKELNNDS